MGMRWAGRARTGANTGAFGGAPDGATKRVKGEPRWACGGRGRHMRTRPLGPSVELPMGPQTV
eukprot:6533048-Pyramimonas_sp.AAC.1